MDKNAFSNLLANKILILDGATGTELQKRGMPKGVCPEKWVSENPDSIIAVQKDYIEAGSNVVYSCTFGANRFKLEEFGLENEVYALNKRLVEISREAVGKSAYVAGDMSPTGKFVEPFGDVNFDNMVSIYSEQAKGLLDGGADFFVIETMIDIQETRAAVIAIKELCDLPIIVSMTFGEDGYTLTGTDPVTALVCLQSLGVDAFGCNCSTGPDKMIEVIKSLKPYSKIPLVAKPNAGLPKLINGKTIFDMSVKEFGSYAEEFVKAGVNLYGGCCGTSPEYIKEISTITSGYKPVQPLLKSLSAVSGPRKNLILNTPRPLTVVGERINPTGKKLFQEQIKNGNFEGVRKFAQEQQSAGAAMLDVNMGMPGVDEKEAMLKAVSLLSGICDLPLCIDSSNPDVIESALRLYPGRALINSISYEKKKIEKLLPIAAKYGAMFIALPLTDDDIPKTAAERLNIFEKILLEAKKYNFSISDIVVDGLVMTVSADQTAALETLNFIKLCKEIYNVNTIVGLSNVSFGLPERKLINASFLSMAIQSGLSMAIANPNEEILINAKFASDVLVGNDAQSKLYIEKYSNAQKVENKTPDSTKTNEDMIFNSVVEGNKEKINDLLKISLDNKITPQDLVDKYLIPAINKVGDLYDKKIYFLPQLIASAETMKKAFQYIEPLLIKSEENQTKKKKIVMATVKGDIHDIGKNIVILMLKNYGFDVVDLGKDVPSEKIIDAAIKENADIIGLSALMTTTMTEMKTVIDLAKNKAVRAQVIIGGAVITEDYAKEIGAAGYSKDSVGAVKLAKSLCGLS
ncbi:MAG TPA: homocysteine S-methyltransferase family protein [Spirochaetota bacterium]|nr:MAG: Methionine synthase [Spirochaetes bacterium ADurb.Bin133]HNZ27169.1 homocysteine S-methyltransferase family protein [Spirochaetota bacterium]HPY87334.1 homocysteine S-methyltransferase family protein [Spirochaetota bacterium]